VSPATWLSRRRTVPVIKDPIPTAVLSLWAQSVRSARVEGEGKALTGPGSRISGTIAADPAEPQCLLGAELIIAQTQFAAGRTAPLPGRSHIFGGFAAGGLACRDHGRQQQAAAQGQPLAASARRQQAVVPELDEVPGQHMLHELKKVQTLQTIALPDGEVVTVNADGEILNA
jgi:hypothetical protein